MASNTLSTLGTLFVDNENQGMITVYSDLITLGSNSKLDLWQLQNGNCFSDLKRWAVQQWYQNSGIFCQYLWQNIVRFYRFKVQFEVAIHRGLVSHYGHGEFFKYESFCTIKLIFR